MTSIRLLWLLLGLFWIVAELYIARKTRLDKTTILEIEEYSQKFLWITMICGLLFALLFKTVAWAPIPMDYGQRQQIALIFFGLGLWIRYGAVMSLGRFFTTQVTIQLEHQLVSNGLYRWIRHPAYTGLLIAFAAAGFAMGDVMALLTLTIPTFVALNFRISIEEKILEKKFGSGYRDYQNKTWKLLPWLY